MSYAHCKNVFSKNKAFAFALSLCMILTIFPVCAFAAGAPNYQTLDEIPEDANIFRSIQTGAISVRTLNGEFYYQFDNPDYPRVRIKASAFVSQPHNDYLDADNFALSIQCQDDGGTSRICYYKTMSYEKNPYSGDDVYTFSMYRLKLTAQVNKQEGVLDAGATLTGGVTFVYTPAMVMKGLAKFALQRVTALPLRPSIAADSFNASQDVSILSYIAKATGVPSEVSDDEKFNFGLSSVGCASSVLGLLAALDPEGFSKMGLAAAALGTAGACPSPIVAVFKANATNTMETESAVYRCGASVVIPAKFVNPDNTMLTTFKLNCRNFTKSDTQFVIIFNFSN